MENETLKKTKNRKLIIDIIKNSSRPLPAEEIYQLAKINSSLNLSTVYRSLLTLTKKGVLLKQVMQDGKSYYQFNNNTHKHVIVCQNCHKLEPIDNCPFESLEKSIEKETGFAIVSHNIELSGICQDCKKKS